MMANDCSFQLESLLLWVSCYRLTHDALQTLCKGDCMMNVESLYIRGGAVKEHCLEYLHRLEYLAVTEMYGHDSWNQDIFRLFHGGNAPEESMQTLKDCLVRSR